tara:strand:- start:448 stop:651 length:204 start_codon:yes stop_codon:yes gene_type:complete
MNGMKSDDYILVVKDMDEIKSLFREIESIEGIDVEIRNHVADASHSVFKAVAKIADIVGRPTSDSDE